LFVFFPSMSLKRLKPPTKDHEPPVPIMPLGIVAYGFVGQPFSKQLYIIKHIADLYEVRKDA